MATVVGTVLRAAAEVKAAGLPVDRSCQRGGRPSIETGGERGLRPGRPKTGFATLRLPSTPSVQHVPKRETCLIRDSIPVVSGMHRPRSASSCGGYPANQPIILGGCSTPVQAGVRENRLENPIQQVPSETVSASVSPRKQASRRGDGPLAASQRCRVPRISGASSRPFGTQPCAESSRATA